MIDPISLAAGGALLTSGWLAGRLRHRPPRRLDPQVCGCGHHLATHDLERGGCLEDVRRDHYWDNGSRNGYEWVRCGCVRYTGEVPLDLSQLGLPGWGEADPRKRGD